MSEQSEPLRVRIRVTPDSRREHITEGKKGVLEVSVREPAEDNRANHRAVELIAHHFHIPVKAVRIVKGHHMKVKTLEIMHA